MKIQNLFNKIFSLTELSFGLGFLCLGFTGQFFAYPFGMVLGLMGLYGLIRVEK